MKLILQKNLQFVVSLRQDTFQSHLCVTMIFEYISATWIVHTQDEFQRNIGSWTAFKSNLFFGLSGNKTFTHETRVSNLQCYENNRMTIGASQRRWAPQTTRETHERSTEAEYKWNWIENVREVSYRLLHQETSIC